MAEQSPDGRRCPGWLNPPGHISCAARLPIPQAGQSQVPRQPIPDSTLSIGCRCRPGLPRTCHCTRNSLQGNGYNGQKHQHHRPELVPPARLCSRPMIITTFFVSVARMMRTAPVVRFITTDINLPTKYSAYLACQAQVLHGCRVVVILMSKAI